VKPDSQPRWSQLLGAELLEGLGFEDDVVLVLAPPAPGVKAYVDDAVSRGAGVEMRRSRPSLDQLDRRF